MPSSVAGYAACSRVPSLKRRSSALANPDLVRRFRDDLSLNAPDPSIFFTPGAKGYTDYPHAP